MDFSLEIKSYLRRWIRAEAKRRSEDKNFKFIKFDFLSEIISERTNLHMRERYAVLTDLWKKVCMRMDNVSAEEEMSRWKHLQKLFSEKGIKTNLINTSKNHGTQSWHLTAEMENLPVELTMYSGYLRLRFPYRYLPGPNYDFMSEYPGIVPYTDEQLILVLTIADKAFPEIEKTVMKYVTSLLAQKTARTISDISSNAVLRRILDNTMLSYTTRQTAKGTRVVMPVGDKSYLCFRVSGKDVNNLNGKTIQEAHEAAEKIIRLLGDTATLINY